MFSSSHEIWKFAYAGDELDDWLGYAEGLVRKWSSQKSDEVAFETTFDIIIAAYLLKDGLLPASARTAFAELMLETIGEGEDNKLHLKCLHIRPPKPGRKENPRQTYIRCTKVMALIQEGYTATDAYGLVAEEHFRSVDTIRREYERTVLKEERKRKETGEID